MREEGFTLIELLIVLAFLGIIMLIATPLTLENIRRARAENQIQTLYSNIAEARQRSLQRNLNYLIQVTDQAVNVFEDQDEDATADANEKITNLSLNLSGALTYKLIGTVGAGVIDGTAKIATANRKGYIQPTIGIHIDQESRHNCIEADFTRVTIGKYNGTICQFQ